VGKPGCGCHVGEGRLTGRVYSLVLPVVEDRLTRRFDSTGSTDWEVRLTLLASAWGSGGAVCRLRRLVVSSFVDAMVVRALALAIGSWLRCTAVEWLRWWGRRSVAEARCAGVDAPFVLLPMRVAALRLAFARSFCFCSTLRFAMT
jgi:hypothetical protein